MYVYLHSVKHKKEMNLSVNRTNDWPILCQSPAGHIEGNDSCRLWYCHDRVGKSQWAIITPDSQLDAAGVGPKEGSTYHTC